MWSSVRNKGVIGRKEGRRRGREKKGGGSEKKREGGRKEGVTQSLCVILDLNLSPFSLCQVSREITG